MSKEKLVVSSQPTPSFGAVESPTEQFSSNIPRGLEYLASVDQLIIKQEINLMEVVTSWVARNRYQILNTLDQQAYYAHEESDTCNRVCCGAGRGFILHITDNNQEEVMTLVRDFQCCHMYTCCQDGCSMYPIYIKDKYDVPLGMVRAMNYCCTPRFGIFDAYDALLYEIRGVCCPIQGPCCTEDIEYTIIRVVDGNAVGNIGKQWGGYLKEAFTRADTFGVQFPIDLDVKHKALMLAAVFLIDIMVFERVKRRR